MNIKIESGANVHITDKPIVNVYGDVVQHQEVHIYPERQDAEEAEVTEAEEVVDVTEKAITISVPRQNILDQLLALVDRGDWKHDVIADGVKKMLLTVLGQGDTPLTGKEAEISERVWQLLENGRGDRVKIVWQNLVGYLDDKKLFRQKGSPALNKDFFGNEEGYPNIDKGRPSRENMSSGFRDILPLLDAYVPKLDKKT